MLFIGRVRSGAAPGMERSGLLEQLFCQPKIGQVAALAPIQHNIAWLDVAMHDAQLVEIFQRRTNLRSQADHLFER